MADVNGAQNSGRDRVHGNDGPRWVL